MKFLKGMAFLIIGCPAAMIATATGMSLYGYVWGGTMMAVTLQDENIPHHVLADGSSLHTFGLGREIVCRDGQLLHDDLPRFSRTVTRVGTWVGLDATYFDRDLQAQAAQVCDRIS